MQLFKVVLASSLVLVACSGAESSGPLVATQLTAASTSTLSAVVGTAVATPPRVRALGQGGSPVSGVPVTFAVTAGGGAVVGGAATTDADGYATVGSWTLGASVGTNTLVATTAALPGVSVTFTATATAGAPATIEFSRDSLLLDQWGDTLRVAVVVRDAGANVIATPTLTWSTQDATVATVNAGLASGVRTGRTLLEVSASFGTFPAIQATIPARVVLQRNTMCTPSGAVARGAATGTATYGSVELITAFGTPAWDGSRSIAFDFDGDGDDDVIRFEYSFPSSTPYSGVTHLFKNDGGQLRDSTDTYLPGGIIANHPRDFEVADFDGDGVRELLLVQHGFDADPFPGAADIYLRRVGATLVNQAATSFAGFSSSAFSHGSSTADVDCDGDLDILELSLTSAFTNRLWINAGNGTFTDGTAKAPTVAGASGQRWQEVEFLDFDSDGDPDLFLGARSGAGWNEDLLLVNDGFGNFRRTTAVQTPAPRYATAHGINQAKAADFDGDGRQDLLVFEIPQPFSSTSALRLWLNDGDGTFTDASVAWGLPSECTGELVEPLYVRDLNGDGWPDAVLPPGCPNFGSAGILTNTGTSFSKFDFASLEAYLANDWATPVDIDGNGRIGLFFGERGGNPALVRRP